MEELKKLEQMLKIDEDNKVVLFDHIQETEQKFQEVNGQITELERTQANQEEALSAIVNEQNIVNKELDTKIEETKSFVEDAVAHKIDGKNGLNGKDGYTPLKGKDYFTQEEINRFLEEVTPIKGVDYFDGEDGKPGKDGESIKGEKGDIPKHEWEGTSIRFELPNGEWGEWIDLKGKDGKDGKTGQSYSVFGGGGSDGVKDHGLLQGLTDDDHTQYLLADGTRNVTGDLIGKDFINIRSGTITRTGNYISSVSKTGGRTLTITRAASNYISSITDGTRTYSFTRNGSNQITSWTVT